MSETKEKIYPKGIITFPKNDKAPDFVKGTLIITPNDLVTWLKENPNLLTDYNGTKQLKCQILEGNKGLYLVVDTFVPTPKAESKPANEDDDDLPF